MFRAHVLIIVRSKLHYTACCMMTRTGGRLVQETATCNYCIPIITGINCLVCYFSQLCICDEMLLISLQHSALLVCKIHYLYVRLLICLIYRSCITSLLHPVYIIYFALLSNNFKVCSQSSDIPKFILVDLFSGY